MAAQGGYGWLLSRRLFSAPSSHQLSLSFCPRSALEGRAATSSDTHTHTSAMLRLGWSSCIGECPSYPTPHRVQRPSAGLMQGAYHTHPWIACLFACLLLIESTQVLALTCLLQMLSSGRGPRRLSSARRRRLRRCRRQKSARPWCGAVCICGFAAQHDNAQHDNAQHDNAQHDNAQHDNAQHDNAQHDHAQHDNAQHDHAQHDNAQHCTGGGGGTTACSHLLCAAPPACICGAYH